jgi:peptidyl-tRNA hydrolase, PTH1 family
VEGGWLVAGLGNPGAGYVGTRHNLGFAVVERLAGGARFTPGRFQSDIVRIQVDGVPVLLLKPQTYMNRSGDAVGAWMDALGLSPGQLIVVHDDLDLPAGRIRVVAEAGPGGHRGVASIQARLGTTAFPRVRIGIGRPQPGEAAEERVLRPAAAEEALRIAAALPDAIMAIRAIIGEGAMTAMNRYNRRESDDPPLVDAATGEIPTEKAR